MGVRGANSACAARRFACEAFAHEPIYHQLGLNLKLGWCGLHDCAGPPSLPARNPEVNFGCDWWIVDVAVDRGAIRHDALPQAKWTTAKARIKGCYRLGVLTIGSKDIVLEYTVPMAPGDGASDLREPRRLAGHITLKVFAGFVALLGTSLGAIGWLGGILPLALTVALTALELLVAFLQAYVFAILTCIYLNDAIHPGH